MSETNEGAVVEPENNEGEEKEQETEENVVKLPKEEYDKLQQDLGSTKRELKELKKAKKEESKEKETPEKTDQDEKNLLEKLERLALRQAGIDHPEDIELARNTADKWKMDIDEVLADEDFKAKLKRVQDNRANTVATSDIKAGKGTSSAKQTKEYWVKKGVPPSREDVPDRKLRAEIANALINKEQEGGKFYNE